jgi:RecB family exonuclease
VEKSGTVRLSVPAQSGKGTDLIESRWLADCITFDEAVLEKVPASRMTLIKAEGAAHAGTDVLSPRYFETIHNLQDEIVTANRQLSESRSRYKFDKYNGKIEHPGLKDFFEHWSASGFELYAKNPFDFFMKNILGLKEPGLDATAEAFSELDAMDFGTFMHACLENLTNLFVQQGSLDETDIDNTLQEVLVNVPVDHEDWQEKYPELLALLQAGKVDEAITQQLSNQIQDAREKLIKWSAYFQEEIEGYKVYTETAFTTKKGTGKELSMLDGTSIMLDGRIDRTDVNSATNLKRVVDYKTGKPHDIDPNDLTAGGRKFQLQLYALLASEEPDFSDIEKAEYQYFRCEDPPQARTATQEALAASRELTLAYLTAMRACIESGIFPYKGAKYGSPFMTLALDQESDRNRLSRFLHNPYKHELEKIKMSADQSTREKVIAGLSAYEGEGY